MVHVRDVQLLGEQTSTRFRHPSGLVALTLVSVALAVWPQLGGTEMYNVPKQALLAVTATLGVVWLGSELRRTPFCHSTFDVLWGAHLGLGALSALASGDVWTSGASWLLPLLGASVLLALTSRAIAIAPEKSNQLLDWVVLAAVLVAMVALYEAAGGALPWLSSRRPHSTLGNRNFVAADCAVALILAIYRSLRRPGVVSAVAVVVLTTVVLVTRCRSAWLGLLVVAGLTPVLLGRLAWRSLRDCPKARVAAGLTLGALGVGVALAILLPWSGLHWRDARPLTSTATRLLEHEVGTGRARLDDYVLGLQIWREHPLLGVGPRGWDDASSRLAHFVNGRHATAQPFWSTPNSDLVRVLAEQGALGLVTLLASLGVLVRSVFDTRVEAPLHGPRWAALLAMSVLLVHGMLDAPLFRISSALTLAVLAGVMRHPASKERALAAPVARFALAAVALSLLVGTTARVASCYILLAGRGSLAARATALRLYPRAVLAEATVIALARHDRCDLAASMGQRALALGPHHFGVPRALAACFQRAKQPAQAIRYERLMLDIEPHARELTQLASNSQSFFSTSLTGAGQRSFHDEDPP